MKKQLVQKLGQLIDKTTDVNRKRKYRKDYLRIKLSDDLNFIKLMKEHYRHKIN